MATLWQVHTSPLKPCAWAPWANNSGNLARSSSLRRGVAPGGGLCLKSCTPFSLARFIHWLTAPSLTPRASAISVCFQPRSFSSKARKRLPSRQSLAWLDNVFSIVEYSIPLSLHLYAEISRLLEAATTSSRRARGFPERWLRQPTAPSCAPTWCRTPRARSRVHPDQADDDQET